MKCISFYYFFKVIQLNALSSALFVCVCASVFVFEQRHERVRFNKKKSLVKYMKHVAHRQAESAKSLRCAVVRCTVCWPGRSLVLRQTIINKTAAHTKTNASLVLSTRKRRSKWIDQNNNNNNNNKLSYYYYISTAFESNDNDTQLRGGSKIERKKKSPIELEIY